MMKNVCIVFAILAVVALHAHAVPWQWPGSGNNGNVTPTPAAPGTTPSIGGEGGAGGSAGICWGFGSSCVNNCKRLGYDSGYCFFFRCYCTKNTTPPPPNHSD